MKLAPSKMPAGNLLVYEYGVRLDKNTIEPAVNQILMARRLYNRIIAEIRETLELMRLDVLRRAGASAQALQLNIDMLSDELTAAREANDNERRKNAAIQRKELLKQLAVQLKAVRATCRAEHQTQFFSRIGKRSTCATYQLRCQAVTEGLGWGTANAILDSALIAFKKSFSVGNLPRFSVAEEKSQDTLTLQFTAAGGISATNLFAGQNNDLSIRADNGCGPRKYGEFKFRLGRASDNQFATGTWQYHRPLPIDASIGRARLLRRKIGKDYRWYLQLQVKTAEPLMLKSENRQPLGALHFGRASDISGRRVAAFTDSPEPSAAQIIQLPSNIERALRRSAKLQSERDKLRDAVVPQIKTQLTSEVKSINDELASVQHLPPHHVSLSRIHRLCRLVSASMTLPAWLEGWRKIDRHLWQTSAHIARRARNQRRDFYRKFALDTAKKYSAIVIESSESINDHSGNAITPPKSSGRVLVAPYEFESAIRWACTKTGAALLELSEANTTTTCAICSDVSLKTSAESQVLNCSSCGAQLDSLKNGAALAYQLVSPLRDDAVEEFFVQAAEAQQMEEQARKEKQNKIRNSRILSSNVQQN